MEAVKYQDNDFQSAFNSGYTLAKYEPKLLEQLLFEAEQSGSHMMEGLLWGKKEFENEMKRDHVQEFARLREKGKDKEKDLGRNR